MLFLMSFLHVVQLASSTWVDFPYKVGCCETKSDHKPQQSTPTIHFKVKM
jgi:hypothetical protein